MRVPEYISIERLRDYFWVNNGFIMYDNKLFTDGRLEVACYIRDRYRQVRIPGIRSSMQAHRVVWAIHHGYWPKMMIDHINGNCFDNNIANLRLATKYENARNRKSAKGSTSNHVGVSWCKRSKKWRSTIEINSKTVFLGRFFSEIDAANAYKCRAKKEYGDFVR